MNIKIIFKDGSTRVFLHSGRAGGSYTKSLKYSGGFAIVVDEWDQQTAFPSETIREVVTNTACYPQEPM